MKIEFQWLIHNTIGHMVYGICNFIGVFVPRLKSFGLWFHDLTLPGGEE